MVAAVPFHATKGAPTVVPTPAWHATPTPLKPTILGPPHGSPRQSVHPGILPPSGHQQSYWSPPLLQRDLGTFNGPSSPGPPLLQRDLGAFNGPSSPSPPSLPRDLGAFNGPSTPGVPTMFQPRPGPPRQVRAPPATSRARSSSPVSKATDAYMASRRAREQDTLRQGDINEHDALKAPPVDTSETPLTWAAFLELNPTIAANVGEAAIPGTEAYQKAAKRVEEAASVLSQDHTHDEGNVTPRPPVETPLRKGMSASKAAKERQRAEAQLHKEKMERLRDAESERQRLENERLRAEAEQRRTEAKRKRLEAERQRVEQRQQMAREMRQANEEARRANEAAAAEEARRALEARRLAEPVNRDKSPRGRRQTDYSANQTRGSSPNAHSTFDTERRRSKTPAADRSKSPAARSKTPPVPKGVPSRSRTSRGSDNRRGRSPEAPQHDNEDQRLRREAELEEERRRIQEEEQRRLQEAERLKQEEERRAKIAASRQRIADAGYAWYCVLGVCREACEDEVKRAYRELVLLHHPDKCLDGDDSTFKQIQEAYKHGVRVCSSRPACTETDLPKADTFTSSFRPPADRAPVFEKDTRKSANVPRVQIPHDLLLISASADRTARAWNCHAGECDRTLLGHTKEVVSACCTTDGKHVATGSYDRTAKLWELATGTCKKTVRDVSNAMQQGIMLKPSLSIDGSHFATVGHGNHIKTWSTKSGLCEQVLRGHTAEVRCIAFSPNGRILVSGSNDQSVRVWNLAAGRCQSVLKGHQGSVVAVAVAPGGDWIGSASEDGTTIIWNLCSCKPVFSLQGHTDCVNALCFSSDGSRVATGSADGSARIWKLESGECMQVLSARMGSVNSVAFSPDALLLATGSDDSLARIWCPVTGTCLQKLQGHEDVVSSVCFAARPWQV